MAAQALVFVKDLDSGLLAQCPTAASHFATLRCTGAPLLLPAACAYQTSPADATWQAAEGRLSVLLLKPLAPTSCRSRCAPRTDGLGGCRRRATDQLVNSVLQLRQLLQRRRGPNPGDTPRPLPRNDSLSSFISESTTSGAQQQHLHLQLQLQQGRSWLPLQQLMAGWWCALAGGRRACAGPAALVPWAVQIAHGRLAGLVLKWPGTAGFSRPTSPPPSRELFKGPFGGGLDRNESRASEITPSSREEVAVRCAVLPLVAAWSAVHLGATMPMPSTYQDPTSMRGPSKAAASAQPLLISDDSARLPGLPPFRAALRPALQQCAAA